MDTSNSRNRGRKQARRQNPKMVVFISLAGVLGCFAALMYTATVVESAATKSGYTQSSGLPRSGVVTSVTNYDGKDQSSDVAVRLAEPVDGQTVTTAHIRPITSLKAGATVQVLVDPKDPGYAEFPGHRYESNSVAQVSATALLVCIAFFAFSTAWWSKVWYRQRKRTRTAGIQDSRTGGDDLSVQDARP